MSAMQRQADRVTGWRRRRRARCHPRQRSQPWDNRPTNGTYRDNVASSDGAGELARVRFARLVSRVLADARDRGMTDHTIAEATGVGVSTFHRWQRGDFTRAPGLDRVRAFCAGLGVPVEPALLALGVTGGRDDAEPEPAIEPDVRRILRMLADPAVPDERKVAIRGMLRLIAREARQTSREISA